MADKVQKIKQEIGRLSEEYPMSRGLLKHLNKFIDSLTEEPKCIYNKTLDERKKLCKYCSAYCVARIEEESVSEDLEEAADKYAKEQYPWQNGYEKWELPIMDFKAGAEWQKQKDYKMYAHIPLKEIHDAWQELKKNKPDIENYPAVCFQKGADWQHGKDFDDLLQSEMKFPKEYYERGRFDMREEMMKDALDGCVSLIVKSDTSSRNLFISTPQLYKELQKYNDGDKVKIIIVKED